jgi:hypothetical protein
MEDVIHGIQVIEEDVKDVKQKCKKVIVMLCMMLLLQQ